VLELQACDIMSDSIIIITIINLFLNSSIGFGLVPGISE
jgi:hypothetical protein